MKKRTLAVVIAALTITALAATFVYAGPHGFRGRHRGGGMFDPISHVMAVREQLDLSDAQVDQIKTVFRDLREENAPHRQQVKGTIHQAAAVLLANPNDVAGAQAIVDRQAAAEKALKTNTINAVARALNVLTPQQRVKLAALAQKHMEQRRGHGAH
ncbi:MAG TPA: periplasmic heavy metal sensor [Thermoanaerobaculia bacterium]